MDKRLYIKDNRSQKGISIYLAILIMSVILAVVLGLNSVLIGQIKTIRQAGYSVTAFYAAETGIEEALIDPNCTTTCSGYTNKPLSLGSGGTAYYSVYGYSPGVNGCTTTATYCLKSVGLFSGVKRAIQITR